MFLGVPLSHDQIHAGDFFAYCRDNLFEPHMFGLIASNGKGFDAVLGNPPFIRYQNFPEGHREVAFDLMRRAGLHPNRLTNAWVPFLVVSTFLPSIVTKVYHHTRLSSKGSFIPLT